LKAAFLIEDEYGRFLTFVRIAEQTEAPTRALAVAHAKAVLSKGIDYVLHRAEALQALAPYLAPPERDAALEAAFGLATQAAIPAFRVSTIINLMPDLPERLRPMAARYALDGIAGSAFPTHDLIHLARYARADLGRSILIKALRSTKSEQLGFRGHLLMDLAKLFDGARRSRILKAARRAIEALPDPDQKARELAQLMGFVPDHEQDELFHMIIELTQKITDNDKRTNTMVHILPILPEKWRMGILGTVYRAAVAITTSAGKAHALSTLASLLPSRPQAFEAARLSFEAAKTLKRDHDRLTALISVAPLLRDEQRLEALDLILDSCSRLKRSSAASAIEKLPSIVAQDAQSAVIPAAMDWLSEIAMWLP